MIALKLREFGFPPHDQLVPPTLRRDGTLLLLAALALGILALSSLSLRRLLKRLEGAWDGG